MHNELYADGVRGVTVTGNIVRIDFVSLSPTEVDANDKPVAVLCQRIIMPVEAFANTAELMKNVQAGLIKSGAIKMQQAPSAPQTAPPASTTVQAGSPNFR